MSDLTDFMARRETELQTRYDALAAEIATVRAELVEVRSAAAALNYKAKPPSRRPGPRAAAGPSHSSIQGACLRAVTRSPDAMTATEILAVISVDLEREIDRTSLAPQLSRLCAAGRLVNIDGRYSLAGRAALDAARETGGGRDG